LKLWKWYGITKPIRTLPGKLCGRPLILGKNFNFSPEDEGRWCNDVIIEGGDNSCCGILKAYDEQMLADNKLEDDRTGSG